MTEPRGEIGKSNHKPPPVDCCFKAFSLIWRCELVCEAKALDSDILQTRAPKHSTVQNFVSVGRQRKVVLVPRCNFE